MVRYVGMYELHVLMRLDNLSIWPCVCRVISTSPPVRIMQHHVGLYSDLNTVPVLTEAWGVIWVHLEN